MSRDDRFARRSLHAGIAVFALLIVILLVKISAFLFFPDRKAILSEIADWLLYTGCAFSLIVGLVMVRRGRALRRSEYRLCPGCGYDLTGLDDKGLCPECGRAYVTAEVQRFWRTR